jgi:hypothetical protein
VPRESSVMFRRREHSSDPPWLLLLFFKHMVVSQAREQAVINHLSLMPAEAELLPSCRPNVQAPWR